MKFSLINDELDESKLKNNIVRYVYSDLSREPYIFMNKETARALARQNRFIKYEYELEDLHYCNSVIAKYSGYKVYFNDDLGYGVVEIR
jgi:hypothetical protein